MIFRILFLLFGVYTASLAVIIIRASATPPAVLAAWRQLIAAIVLSPFFLRALMSGRHEFGLKEFKAAGWCVWRSRRLWELTQLSTILMKFC